MIYKIFRSEEWAELEANGQSMMHETAFHKEAVRRFVEKEPALFNWDENAG